ncbi:MAG TPA: diacylglycerol kinase family protein, partial [Ktedonobacterales bacterium]
SVHPHAEDVRSPVFILNPASRHGRRIRRPLERALTGGHGELALTDARGAAERLAAQAALSGRAIVAVGGDGTIAEVANGILASGASVPLGIIPAGNGNDYAYRTLHLPADLPHALEIALTGTPVAMDVGQVNGRYFVNALGVGIDANIAAAAEQMKNIPLLRGQALYYAASLRELLFHYDRCPELTIAADGRSDDRRLYALAAVSIGPTYGGGFQINPGADPRDGLFDVCTIWKPKRSRALRLLPMVEKGQHLSEPEVKRFHAREVVLESAGTINAHLDGEIMRAARFEASLLPRRLLVRQAPTGQQA